MNLTKNALAYLLTCLLMIISSTTYAASDSQSITGCGLLENSKDIDGFSSTVCPQNKSLQTLTSFFGDFATISFGQEFYETIESLKNEQQKAQDEDNQTWTNITIAYIWKIALGIFWIMLCGLVLHILVEMKRGKFNDDDAKYDAKTLFFVSAFFVSLIPGLLNGMSIAQNVLYISNPLSLRLEQFIMQNYSALRQRGDIEYVKKTTPVEDSFYANGSTMSSASAITYAMAQKSVMLKINSNLYNYRFNLLNKNNYKLYDDFSDVIQNTDNTFVEFIKKNPERPSEDLFRLGAVEVYKSGNAGNSINSYLKEISYESTYGTHSEIEYSKLIAEAQALKKALSDVIYERGEKRGTYETVVNSAIAKYYYDVRSNWLKKYLVEQSTNGRFDKLAYAVIDGACSENPSARLESHSYLKDRTGTPVCLTKDWKIAGEGKTEDYKKIVADEIRAIRLEIYSNLININTALRNSIANEETDNEMKQILQCGVYCFIQRLFNLADKTAFTEDFLSLYNNRPFYSLFDVTATDSYLRDEWLKSNGTFDEASYPLKINEYMKNFMTIDYASSSSIPVADPQTLLQTSFISNSAFAIQNKNFENANNFQLESINKSLTRSMNSSASAQTGMAMYGEQLIHIGEKGIVTVLAATVVGTAADKYVTTKKAKSTKETAKIGDTKKLKSKNTGSFSFFTRFFSYLANLIVPAMTYLITLGGTFAFLIPMLGKLPFIMLRVFADFYAIIMTIFVSLLMYRAIYLHTVESAQKVMTNLISIFVVNLALKPFILIMFIINFHISDMVMKAIYPVIANNYTDAMSQTSGVISTAMSSYATLFIMMFLVNMTVLYATLAQISKFLKHFQQEFLFSKLIIDTIDGFLFAIHLCTLGFTKLLTDLAHGITKKRRR